MSRDVSQLLQQAEAVISELTDEIRAEIEAAERQASENVSRFFELQEEAKQAEDRAKLLWAELERLPSEHHKAVLDSDRTREQQLTGRYKELKSELAALRVRVPEIEREMRRLCPRQSLPDGWHRHDPYLYQQARVAKTFAESTRPLYKLRNRLTDALDKALEPLEGAQQRRVSALEGLAAEARSDARQKRQRAVSAKRIAHKGGVQ
jgi:hypothetical protein